jgi:hypothetical protein
MTFLVPILSEEVSLSKCICGRGGNDYDGNKDMANELSEVDMVLIISRELQIYTLLLN